MQLFPEKKEEEGTEKTWKPITKYKEVHVEDQVTYNHYLLWDAMVTSQVYTNMYITLPILNTRYTSTYVKVYVAELFTAVFKAV